MSKHWSDEKIKRLKHLSAQGLTDKEIARILGVSRKSVKGKRFREGIKKPYFIDIQEYVAYKGDEFLAAGTIKEISEETGYTIGTLEYASYPVHHKRAGKRAVKLYKIEEG